MEKEKINLVGISGYIGSGKDEVAQMIQYLQLKSNLAGNNLELFGKVDHYQIFSKWSSVEKYKYSGWQIKKFAGKLKEMASLLTGIPVRELENSEVKNSKLGEKWDSWFYINGSGDKKYTVTEQVACMEHTMGYGKEEMTVRDLLQKLGTDAVRDHLHPNAWINALFADYKLVSMGLTQVDFSNQQPTRPLVKPKVVEYPSWIISDCRFPNEAQAIKDRGGVVIRINRPESRSDNPFVDKILTESKNFKLRHSSETSLDDWNFDSVINNNGTLEELLQSVKLVCTHLNII